MLIMFKELKEKQCKDTSLSSIIQVDYGIIQVDRGLLYFFGQSQLIFHTDLLGWPSVPCWSHHSPCWILKGEEPDFPACWLTYLSLRFPCRHLGIWHRVCLSFPTEGWKSWDIYLPTLAWLRVTLEVLTLWCVHRLCTQAEYLPLTLRLRGARIPWHVRQVCAGILSGTWMGTNSICFIFFSSTNAHEPHSPSTETNVWRGIVLIY